jgi:hypothetical protein
VGLIVLLDYGEEKAKIIRMVAARSHLESLLRARKLDVTVLGLTGDAPGASALGRTTVPAEDRAATGVPAIDDGLQGGLRRGHLSEIVGRRSSGRTSVMLAAMRAAMARDELVSLIDTHDRFDPASASAAGLDLTRLLWIREAGDIPRALKAMNLVLQAGGFGLVVFDLADAEGPAVRGLPFTTWFRLARVIEGSPTVALVVASEHLARSSGGATIGLDSPASLSRAVWTGRSNRARLLSGLDVNVRVV